MCQKIYFRVRGYHGSALLKQLGHGGQTPPAEKINGNRRQGYISDINNSSDHIDNWNVNVSVILNWNVSIWIDNWNIVNVINGTRQTGSHPNKVQTQRQLGYRIEL